MRLKTAALLASIWLASSGAALAQVDSGSEVTVNPVYGGRGGVLLYPGGQYMRVVPPLLQPGDNPRGAQVIHLHMPGKHPASSVAAARTPRPTRTASAAPATTASIPGYTPLGADAGPAPAPAPPPRRALAPKPAPTPPSRTAAAAPPPSGSSVNTGFGGLTSGSLLSSPPPPPPTRLAKAEPPPSAATPEESQPLTPGFTKRSVILFAAEASDPARSALGNIKFLAEQLSADMTGPSARLQILAYGGPHGDKGSDARRLSLKRALAIRQILIDDGVSPDRIDVRAMGGADDSGPADRVDIYIKT